VITEIHSALILPKRSLELIQEPHNTLGGGICSYLAIVLEDHDAKNETMKRTKYGHKHRSGTSHTPHLLFWDALCLVRVL
jgi:hypothetical protein